MDVPSLQEIAEKNLSGVTGDYAGGSPRWFGNATADIAKNMTPDVYHEKMIAEINRQEKILVQALEDFSLTAAERPYYENMLKRLRAGRGVNWRDLHKKHTSIVIKPDEEIETIKTGKTEKPKTESKPGNVKSSSKNPKDTKITAAPKKGQRVVQGQKADSRKVRKTRKTPRIKIIRPGFADAGISQAAASGLLDQYGQPIQSSINPSTNQDEFNEFYQNIDGLNVETKKTTNRIKELGQKGNIAIGALSGLTVAGTFVLN
jgi:hypothetical protein